MTLSFFSSRRQSDRRSRRHGGGVGWRGAGGRGIERPGTADGTRCPSWRRVRQETERAIAEHLVNQAPATVLLGNLAVAHPAFAQLRALASFVAACSGAHLGYLPEAASSAGGWLAARCRIACQGHRHQRWVWIRGQCWGAPQSLCAAGVGSRNWIAGMALRR